MGHVTFMHARMYVHEHIYVARVCMCVRKLHGTHVRRRNGEGSETRIRNEKEGIKGGCRLRSNAVLALYGTCFYQLPRNNDAACAKPRKRSIYREDQSFFAFLRTTHEERDYSATEEGFNRSDQG